MSLISSRPQPSSKAFSTCLQRCFTNTSIQTNSIEKSSLCQMEAQLAWSGTVEFLIPTIYQTNPSWSFARVWVATPKTSTLWLFYGKHANLAIKLLQFFSEVQMAYQLQHPNWAIQARGKTLVSQSSMWIKSTCAIRRLTSNARVFMPLGLALELLFWACTLVNLAKKQVRCLMQL